MRSNNKKKIGVFPMKQTEGITYIIEREFLGKITIEELITKIIESHINN